MNTSLPPIDPAIYTEQAGVFLQETLKTANIENVVIAVSGGIDSAVTLSLALRSLPPSSIYVISMPHKTLNATSNQRAIGFAQSVGIPEANISTIDIKPLVDMFSELDPDQLRLANITARIRMIVLYDTAKKINALVLGTENRSEYHLGYFTRFGDEASDIELIRALYKTHVYELAYFLNLPQEIIEAFPSAELWPGQTDEKELGFSYKEADPILYLLCDKGFSAEQVVEKGFDTKTVTLIKKHVDAVRFKHYVPHVFNP